MLPCKFPSNNSKIILQTSTPSAPPTSVTTISAPSATTINTSISAISTTSPTSTSTSQTSPSPVPTPPDPSPNLRSGLPGSAQLGLGIAFLILLLLLLASCTYLVLTRRRFHQQSSTPKTPTKRSRFRFFHPFRVDSLVSTRPELEARSPGHDSTLWEKPELDVVAPSPIPLPPSPPAVAAAGAGAAQPSGEISHRVTDVGQTPLYPGAGGGGGGGRGEDNMHPLQSTQVKELDSPDTRDLEEGSSVGIQSPAVTTTEASPRRQTLPTGLIYQRRGPQPPVWGA